MWGLSVEPCEPFFQSNKLYTPTSACFIIFLNYPLMYVLLQITEKRQNDKVLLILKLFQKRSSKFISFNMK